MNRPGRHGMTHNLSADDLLFLNVGEQNELKPKRSKPARRAVPTFKLEIRLHITAEIISKSTQRVPAPNGFDMYVDQGTHPDWRELLNRLRRSS